MWCVIGYKSLQGTHEPEPEPGWEAGGVRKLVQEMETFQLPHEYDLLSEVTYRSLHLVKFYSVSA